MEWCLLLQHSTLLNPQLWCWCTVYLSEEEGPGGHLDWQVLRAPQYVNPALKTARRCYWLSAHCLVVVYSDGPEEVKHNVSEAKKMLDLWKSSYLETRAKIEASGRDARWEFDRKKLFEKTDHMSTVCEDLYHVAQVIQSYLLYC